MGKKAKKLKAAKKAKKKAKAMKKPDPKQSEAKLYLRGWCMGTAVGAIPHRVGGYDSEDAYYRGWIAGRVARRQAFKKASVEFGVEFDTIMDEELNEHV